MTVTFFARLAAVLLASGVLIGAERDPFAFYQPDIILTTAERGRLAAGESITRILPARDGQLAVFGATALGVGPQSVAGWAQSRDHRFSEPPVLRDLDDLQLDERDLDALRACRPGHCEVKLAGPDITSLRALTAAPSGRAADALQRWFREMLLRRVLNYRAGGLQCIWPYVDRPVPIRPEDALGALVMGATFLWRNAHQVTDDLVSYPYVVAAPGDSILYWSQDAIGGSAAVTVTHLRVYRTAATSRLPSVLVGGVEVYASHYRTGSLTIVGAIETRSTVYLTYLNRSQVDALRGPLGRLRRASLEGRVEAETAAIVSNLRQRLQHAGSH